MNKNLFFGNGDRALKMVSWAFFKHAPELFMGIVLGIPKKKGERLIIYDRQCSFYDVSHHEK